MLMKSNNLLYFSTYLGLQVKKYLSGGHMIPNSSFSNFYVRFVGEQSLLSMAQSNLLTNMERVTKVRTHTFLSNNAKNETGVSRNYGADRYYSWEDTVIDCRNAPGLVESDVLNDYAEGMSENRRFQKFKKTIEERMGGYITVEPFLSVVRGEENMRYNIKRAGKIEDFDIIRVGFRLKADDEGRFKMGLACLKDHENPFKMRRHIMETAQPFNA